MTTKEQQLIDEIELLYQEGLDNSYGDIINDIEYKSNHLQINALESLQKMGELKAELKGRQEARKELIEEFEKMIDELEIKGTQQLNTFDLRQQLQELKEIKE